MRATARALGLALVGAAASGCYAGGARDVAPKQAAAYAADPAWTVVRDVPFVAQDGDADCGPAALVMVLRRFGVPVTLAELERAQPPRDEGVRAGALRDLARAKGLQAFVVAGTFEDLSTQLARGRPVLVGLAKPMTNGRALAHYEVVVALDRRDRRLLTLDPARGLRENDLRDFAREWAPTGRVALIIFRADDRRSGGEPVVPDARPD